MLLNAKGLASGWELQENRQAQDSHLRLAITCARVQTDLQDLSETFTSILRLLEPLEVPAPDQSQPSLFRRMGSGHQTAKRVTTP